MLLRNSRQTFNKVGKIDDNNNWLIILAPPIAKNAHKNLYKTKRYSIFREMLFSALFVSSMIYSQTYVADS